MLQALGGYDPERGQKVAGHRGYFLKGVGVLLNNALINYGITFLAKRGYDLVQPPFFLKKEIMAETCQLSDFDDQLYKVSEILKTKIFILSQLQNSQFQRCTETNGLSNRNYPLNMEEAHLALENKQVPMEKILGESLESISFKK